MFVFAVHPEKVSGPGEVFSGGFLYSPCSVELNL